MNKTMIAITLTTVLASTVSLAADVGTEYKSTIQDAGLGIGMLTGAIVGGPVGLIIGGFLGAQTSQVEYYKDLLQKKDEQLVSLGKDIAMAQANKSEMGVNTYEQLQQEAHNTTVASNKINDSFETGMRVDVLFRTNSEAIESHYTPQLQRVISVMKLFPNIEVELAGHTDPRGLDIDNFELSKRRINSIRQTLVNSGINNVRIHATAWGERDLISTSRDIEAYAFDRRVVINFVTHLPSANKAKMPEGTGNQSDGLILTNFHQ